MQFAQSRAISTKAAELGGIIGNDKSKVLG